MPTLSACTHPLHQSERERKREGETLRGIRFGLLTSQGQRERKRVGEREKVRERERLRKKERKRKSERERESEKE